MGDGVGLDVENNQIPFFYCFRFSMDRFPIRPKFDMTDGFLIFKEVLYKSKIEASVVLPSPVNRNSSPR
jgi:hypothetical protein